MWNHTLETDNQRAQTVLDSALFTRTPALGARGRPSPSDTFLPDKVQHMIDDLRRRRNVPAR